MTKANHKEVMNNLKRKIEIIDEKYKRFERDTQIPILNKYPQHPQSAIIENHFLNGVSLYINNNDKI